MTITEKITISLLTENLVSIIRKKYMTIDGVETQVGENERISYSNSSIGRQKVVSDIGEPYSTAIFAIWGDQPTVEDPENPNEE